MLDASHSLVKLFFDKKIIVNKYKAVITSIAYLFLLFIILKYAIEIVNGGHRWKTGDWLINYEGGLVRRGLIGQVLYEISGFGVSLLWSTFFLQTLIYLSIVYIVLKLFFSARREAAWLFFIFSPAFIFLFPFYDLNGGFRKEIIVFLSFCLLMAGLIHGRLNHRYISLSLLVYFVAVFSHEIAVFCLIFFLYPLFESTRYDPTLRRIGRAYIIGFFVVGVVGLLFSVVYHGGGNIYDGISDSLKNRALNPEILGGAILFLRYDLSNAMKLVAKKIPSYFFYFPLLILAIIPVFLTNLWKKRLPLLCLGFISIVPLFFIAIDWGRIIHIYIFFVFVLLLFDSCKKEIKIREFPLIVVLIYMSVWSIPLCCMARPTFGLFEWIFHKLPRLFYLFNI